MAGAGLIAFLGACSPVLPPSAAILENGVPLIEYKPCDDIGTIREIKVYPVDNKTDTRPIWTARLRGSQLGLRRIAFADQVPGYEVSATPNAYRSGQVLHATAYDTDGRWLGGPDFRIDDLLEGKALTSLGFDGSTSYALVNRWRLDRSDCPQGGWQFIVAILLIALVVIVVMAIVDRRRRRLTVPLPIPPPSIRP